MDEDPPEPIRRTYWTVQNVRELVDVNSDRIEVDKEVRTRVHDPEQATLIASLTGRGLHAPCLDVDRTVMEFPQGELGTLLCFPDLAGSKESWSALIGTLVELGLHRPLIVPPADPRYAEGYAPDAPIAEVRASNVLAEAMARYRKALLIAAPVTVRPSSTQEHHHVYVDAEIGWPDYKVLLARCRDAGLIEEAWLKASLERGMTMLLRPGLTKARLAAESRELPSAERRRRSGGSGYGPRTPGY